MLGVAQRSERVEGKQELCADRFACGAVMSSNCARAPSESVRQSTSCVACADTLTAALTRAHNVHSELAKTMWDELNHRRNSCVH